MKTTNRKLQVVLTIVSLTFLVFLTVGNTAAGQRPSLSKKEVKALIASAKTKEDHLKLADYYKAETERLEAAAKGSRRNGGDVPEEPNSDGREASGGIRRRPLP